MVDQLPTIADITLIAFLLLPGFISIYVIRKIAVIEVELKNLELVIWSLFASLFIDSLFIYFLGLTELRSLAMLAPLMLRPSNVLLLGALTVGLGAIIGLLIKAIFRRGVKPGGVWEVLFENIKRRRGVRPIWVIVYTSDGKEIQGILKWLSKGPSIPREVILGEPHEIIRNSEGDILSEIPIGKEIYIKEYNIARIAFYEKLT